ncbi:MAG: glutamate racemase [Saprospiraceae bacterium]|jgi:glutamate racemase|nr:glutamate racemase [Saprospiraceae bacterium]
MPGPIGIFDSGYGGLTVFREIEARLPEYDYIYFGDNARAPYGVRSFDTIYKYTLECVRHLFKMDCRLVILACNTASAKALRTIQQQDLPHLAPGYRVLGVIRPTTELVGRITHSGHVGVLATPGTVQSESYVLEVHHFFPQIQVFQQACPMWVPLIENNEHESAGADYFVEKYVQELLMQSSHIDAVILGCTHYPLMWDKIRQAIPAHIHMLAQGQIVADRLADYLIRHPEMEVLCRKTGQRAFFTTETPEVFDTKAGIFYGKEVRSRHFEL